jgi:pimeloyl-ACP methyl ester carboxylesterase
LNKQTKKEKEKRREKKTSDDDRHFHAEKYLQNLMMTRVSSSFSSSSVGFVTNNTRNSKKRLRRRNRGLAVAAAGEKNDSISTSSSEEELFDFFSILSSSIEKKMRKDFNELIREPILSGKPEELRDTIPVEKLADQDSKFLEVYLENESDAEKRRMEEVKVHYKEHLPPIGSFPRNTLLKPQSAIVFLHGANGSTFSFRRLLPLVAARVGVRSISIDRPPYGLTSRPMKTGEFAYSKRGQAKLMVQFLEKLEVENVILVGHSAGTNVAMEMALKMNELKGKESRLNVAGMMFISPAVFVPKPPSLNSSSTHSSTKETISPWSKQSNSMSPERLAKLFWFRTLINNDDYGLNLVRSFTRRNANQVQTGEGSYAALSTQAREAYTRPLAAENWDKALLQQFRASINGGGGFGDDASLVLECEASLDVNFVDVCCGEKDETTPINKARDLHDTLEMISLSRKQQQQQQQRSLNTDSNNNSFSIEATTSGRSSSSPAFSAFQTSFRALENSAHLPMEEIGDSRDAFESYVVQTLERRVEENFVIRV